MYSKKSKHDWELIENNELWKLPAGEMKVLKVLKLSYDHLEPHLKQCFRYCSLYPKDYTIKRKRLIWMWMAEGFFGHSKTSMEMETLGNEYFDSLLINSFFQEERKSDFGINSCYKMHDLVHDLAQSLTKSESSVVTVDRIREEDFSRIRRLSLVFRNDEYAPVPIGLAKVKKLRTFFFTASDYINISYAMPISLNFSYVRVLNLRGTRILELPLSIGSLKYLRYLDLSSSLCLEVLPSSFTTLYNLQTLILKYCSDLEEFPEEMSKLTRLSHLILPSGYPLLKKARFLTSLIYLPVYVVGNITEGCGIEELKDLNLLSGKLKIYNLKNIISEKDAQLGGLNKKQHLLQLELNWSFIGRRSYRGDDPFDDFLVLEGLQPHQNLQRLGIYNYYGSKFPTWMTIPKCLLPNLVHVVLEDCGKCEYLPPFGLLPFLKILWIKGLSAVKMIGNEFYGASIDTNVCYFPCLESLTIFNMKNLVAWEDQVLSHSGSSFSSFPRLEELRIWGCPWLEISPTLQSLKKF
ncbi:putative disease resistance protein RGA4 [Papaver somniferum]|uniref:putative disease resistance protein RGA4 n=1 Tax=Papaver somniferum TaxID=3469 RepID=UPI000E6FBDD7|nr:putative disease resistance protein RGA4 [Papaver somniferum]